MHGHLIYCKVNRTSDIFLRVLIIREHRDFPGRLVVLQLTNGIPPRRYKDLGLRGCCHSRKSELCMVNNIISDESLNI